MRQVKFEELSPKEQELLAEAKQAMETAYNPYSRFFVGAALLSQDGRIITGSNVENAAFGSTICAERAALLRANVMGIRIFEKIAIIARGKDSGTSEVTSPCGSCRQMLYEASQVSGKDFEVIMSTTALDKVVISTISELLPLAFGPKDLGIDLTRYS
jgi:cytidine deaminase